MGVRDEKGESGRIHGKYFSLSDLPINPAEVQNTNGNPLENGEKFEEFARESQNWKKKMK